MFHFNFIVSDSIKSKKKKKKKKKKNQKPKTHKDEM